MSQLPGWVNGAELSLDTRFDEQGRWKETLRSGNAVPRRFQPTDDEVRKLRKQ